MCAGEAVATEAGLDFSAGSSFTRGIAPNANVRRIQYHLGLGRRFSPSFGASVELGGVSFVGSRAGVPVSTLGVSLLPAARWTFLKTDLVKTYFDFGFGGAVFQRSFPPAGTHLNGYSTVGVGIELLLRNDLSVHLQLRQIHHSNGRGFVADNPAFDGVNYGVGASWAL
jgi:Lipid A 3-O-deacylase (PagL)